MRSFRKYFRKVFGIPRRRIKQRQPNRYFYAKPWISRIYTNNRYLPKSNRF